MITHFEAPDDLFELIGTVSSIAKLPNDHIGSGLLFPNFASHDSATGPPTVLA